MTTSNDPDPHRDLAADRHRDEPDDSRERDDEAADNAPIRPSAAEGGEETGGARPPRPSQAEGERDETSRDG